MTRPRVFRPPVRSPGHVLLIGPGRRGLRTVAPAVGRTDGLELVAVVDHIDGAGRGEARRQLPDVPVVHNLASAVDRFRPNLAIVATPHDSHLSIGLELLGQGIPTLIEKPLAPNDRDLTRLIAESDRTRTPLATTSPFRYAEDFGALVEALATMRSAEIRVEAVVAAYSGFSAWRRSRRRSGGGVLLDLGYHYIDLMTWRLGTAVVEYVDLRPAGRGTDDVETGARVRLRFPEADVVAELDLRAAGDTEPFIRVTVDDTIMVNRAYVDRGERSTHGLYAMTRQLRALVAGGFPTGLGSWREDLDVQRRVLATIGRAYAAPVPALEPVE